MKFAAKYLGVLIMTMASTAIAGTVAPLSGYIYSGTCGPTIYNHACADNVAPGGTFGGSSLDTASFGLNSASGPYVSASSGSAYSLGDGISQLQYYVQVNGPTSYVTVDGSYLLSNSFQYSPQAGDGQIQQGGGTAQISVAGTTFGASLYLSVVDFGGSIANNLAPYLTVTSGAAYDAATNTYSNSAQGTASFTMAANTPYLVTLRANGTSESQGASLSSLGTSLVDPLFTLDAAQSNPSLYSFQFSPGIGNGGVSAAPEPESLALIASGLVALAIARLRRKNR